MNSATALLLTVRAPEPILRGEYQGATVAITLPPLMETGPEFVLAAVRVSVPGPVLFNWPAPLRVALMVALPFTTSSGVPERLIEPLLFVM